MLIKTPVYGLWEVAKLKPLQIPTRTKNFITDDRFVDCVKQFAEVTEFFSLSLTGIYFWHQDGEGGLSSQIGRENLAKLNHRFYTILMIEDFPATQFAIGWENYEELNHYKLTDKGHDQTHLRKWDSFIGKLNLRYFEAVPWTIYLMDKRVWHRAPPFPRKGKRRVLDRAFVIIKREIHEEILNMEEGHGEKNSYVNASCPR